MKKRALLSVIVFSLLFMCGCGISAEARKEAAENVKLYKQDFIDKVAEDFGDDAKVKNIKGDYYERRDPLFSSVSIEASGDLTGVIVVDNKKYNALYIPDKNEVLSTYNNDIIMQEMLDILPLDKDQITSVKLHGTINENAMLPKDADTLEEALKKRYLYFIIETKENIRQYHKAEYNGISYLCNRPYYMFEIKITYTAPDYSDMYVTQIESAKDGDFEIQSQAW